MKCLPIKCLSMKCHNVDEMFKGPAWEGKWQNKNEYLKVFLSKGILYRTQVKTMGIYAL